jgi:uncharacterized membrane protein
MYRRHLDILIAGVTALAGGAAYAAHLSSTVQIVLGVALFFAPGYLWSEAILSHRLPPTERLLTSAGLSLILPILGGFLFYALKIPLFRSDWVGLLVVLTLLGVVAVAVQRLREVPPDPRLAPNAQRRGQPARKGGMLAFNVLIWSAAGAVAIGSVAFSVKNTEAQKYTGYTMLWLTGLPATGAPTPSPTPTKVILPTQASLGVTNHQGVAEQYELKLLTKGKVTTTWNFTLSDGQSWGRTVAYTMTYAISANLYLMPNTSTPYRHVGNGVVVVKPTATPTTGKHTATPATTKPAATPTTTTTK